MPYYFGYYDASYILLIIAILFTLFAQMRVSSNFNRYSRVRNSRGLTGQEAARRMLDANGLRDVRIEQIRGSLTDHYDPRKKVLRLSQSVYGVDSVAAISVACHEAGHAVQHANAYVPLMIRNTIVPVVNLASKLSWPLILVGILLLYGGGSAMGDTVFFIGVVAFVFVIAFHAVTLPVEFDASHRALAEMEELGLIQDGDEAKGARRVLKAAALTYVAALATAVIQLLRILAMRNRGD